MFEIANLKAFRDLSADQKRHTTLLKEKKIILYAATLLDSENLEVVSLCLDILENFISNEDAHACLLSTFGVYEALEALSIKMRNKNEKLYQRSVEITDILRNSAPPAYNTRSRLKTGQSSRRQQLFSLFIEDLNKQSAVKLEKVLTKIRGIISFIINTEIKRCTVRICSKINVKEVIDKIFNKCCLKALVVTKNLQTGIEEFRDVSRISPSKSYLEYPEEIYSPKKTAISEKNLVQNSNSILKSVMNMWNDAFYW
ncbi:uncharacterized protein [Leptinotarsa decemlineata]|uniref:uncharacterized protein n=1 Tax=Leptinotarsa decemlineata TaxID=7539 RepID=UPI000C252977|nr:armadillo repeat-containing protein 1-like [Leptinotarsa decemlineata]